MQVVIQPLFSYFPTGNYRIFIILIIIRSYDFKHRKRIFFIIEDDLKKALSYNVQDDIYRFTAPVVKGYLARFYFWTRQWDKAADFATQVMAAYPLLDRDGYKEMMTPAYSLKGNMLIKSETISSSSTESCS